MRSLAIYILLLVFSVELNAQGGNTCATALANPIGIGTLYNNQYTCSKLNDYTTANNCLAASYYNGQDYLYYVCATQNGCLTINMPTVKSGDSSKQTLATLTIFNGCPSTTNCLAASQVVVPASGSITGPSISVNVVAGQCFYVLVDASDSGVAYSDCLEYSLQANFTASNTQTPGGNTCTLASANPMTIGSTYGLHTTVCAGNDYTTYLGQDYIYSFCAIQNGCVKVKLSGVMPAVNGTQIYPYLGAFNACITNTSIPITFIIDSSSVGLFPNEIEIHVQAGTCYYILVDGLTSAAFDYNIQTIFTPTPIQPTGGNTCAIALANQLQLGVPLINQTTCCTGNEDTTHVGDEYIYTYCATQDGCIDFTFSNFVWPNAGFDYKPYVTIYDGCPNSGGVIVKVESFWRLNSPPGPFDYRNSMSINAIAGHCYYVIVDADIPNVLNWNRCFNFDLVADFALPYTNAVGGNTKAQAIANPIILDSLYTNQSTCCTQNNSLQNNGSDWYYYFCSNKSGCIKAKLLDATNGVDFQFIHPHIYLLLGTPDSTNIINSHADITFNPLPGPTPKNDSIDEIFIKANIDSGVCYTIVVDNMVDFSTQSVCINYDFEVAFLDTLTTQPFGGNNCDSADANPVIVNTYYANQSTCCKGNNFKELKSQDWLYKFCAPQKGCIHISTPNSFKSYSDNFTTSLNLFDGCPKLSTTNLLDSATKQLSKLPDYGPDLKYNVDSGVCYYIVFDGSTKGNNIYDDCFSFDLLLDYTVTLDSQTVGGQSCVQAMAKPLVNDSTYTNLTTCCAGNEYTPHDPGQDLIYYYCPPSDGCLSVLLTNVSSGDSNKKSVSRIRIMDTCNIFSQFVGEKENPIPKDILVNFDEVTCKVKAGKCYYIIIDGVEYDSLNSDCYNYDLKIHYSPTIQQYPGGNTCLAADTQLLANNATYLGQSTCCAGNNSTFKIGQDWYYKYCPTQSGCLTVKILNVKSVGPSTFTYGFLGATTTCPNGYATSFIAQATFNQQVDSIADAAEISFNVDSGLCYYILVDDIDGNSIPDCLEYTLTTSFSPKLIQAFGGNTCTIPIAAQLAVAGIYPNQTNCCGGDDYTNNNGQDWYYRVCPTQTGCLGIQLLNATNTNANKIANAVLKVFDQCPTNSATALASTTVSMTSTSPFNSNIIYANVVAGQCYYILVDANVFASNYINCFNYDIKTTFAPGLTIGGNTCAQSLANPLVLNTVYANQSLCNACIGNDFIGTNACGPIVNYGGNDWQYSITAPASGVLNIKLDSIINNGGSASTITVGFYNACPGTAGACITYITKTINPLSIDSISIGINVYQGQQFFILIDGTLSSCFAYNISSNMLVNSLGCNNSDFETGNLSGWNPSLGYSINGCVTCSCPAPYYGTPNIGTSAGRHTVVSSGVDAYGGFPKVFSGSYSLQLGNNNIGANAEGIKQTFLVTANNSSFNYSYAVVFQDPGHTSDVQPFFKAKIKDSLGNVIQCTEFCVSANAAIPGFVSSTVAPNIIYKPWSTVYVDLTSYIGTYINVEFENGDCADGGHFGYSYIDCSCSPSAVVRQDTLCVGQCDTLFAPIGYTNYSWSPIASTNNYLPICPTVNSVYTVSFTTITGCNIQIPYTVLVAPPIVVTDSINCVNGGSVTAKATGGTGVFTYAWSTSPVQTTATITNIPNGTYTVTVSDTKCNVVTHTVTVLFNNPTATVTNQTNVTCYGGNNGSATVNVTNGVAPFAYTWYTSPVQTTATVINLQVGNYLGIVTGDNGCIDSFAVSITQPDSLTISASNAINCTTNNSVIHTSVNGGVAPYQYKFNSLAYQTADSLSVTAGTYIVIVKDANNCTKSTIISIPILFTITANQVATNKCFGQSIATANALITNASGAYTYSWSTIPVQTNALATNLAAGVYTVVVTNASGCSTSSSVTILQPDSLYILDTISATCIGSSVGKIQVGVIGGVPNFVYAWNTIPVSTSASISNLAAGNFAVTITDANLCTITKQFTINALPITNTTSNKTICTGQSYQGQTTSGSYPTTYTSANGCDSIATVILQVLPNILTTITTTICPGTAFNGYTVAGTYIDTFASASNCDSIRTIQLSVFTTHDTSFTITICQNQFYQGYSLAGTYLDTFINAKGCDSVRTLQLIVLPISNTTKTATICNGDSIYLAKAWRFTAGLYLDSFINSNGCDSIINTTLVINNSLIPVINGKTEFCTGDSVVLQVNNFKNYSWNTGQITNTIVVKNGGLYIVTVRNGNACIGIDSILVTENAIPNVDILYTQKDLCKLDTLGLLATGALTYSWYIDAFSNLASELNPYDFAIQKTPTKVFVKGIDANNCMAYDSVTLYYINCCGTVFVPNIFTPNGDDKNNTFEIKTTAAKLEKFSVKIANRFGQIVFESTNLNSNWDGTYLGKNCDQGTYFYIIQTKCLENKENTILKGDVILMR